jgi:hypothetical protein
MTSALAAEVGVFWLKPGPSLDHEYYCRVFASRSNRQQLTDRSSLVAESTRPLTITHGLHTAEAGRKMRTDTVAKSQGPQVAGGTLSAHCKVGTPRLTF